VVVLEETAAAGGVGGELPKTWLAICRETRAETAGEKGRENMAGENGRERKGWKSWRERMGGKARREKMGVKRCADGQAVGTELTPPPRHHIAAIGPTR
jgi:hypothetical protein